MLNHKNMFKKILITIGIIIAIGVILTAQSYYRINREQAIETSLGATFQSFQRSLIPIDSTENVGTSTAPWDEGHFNRICLSADCKTAWPAGGGGGSSGGTFSTSTISNYPYFGNYPNNATDVVWFGSVTGTSTAKFWFDPNYGKYYFSGNGTTTGKFAAFDEIKSTYFTATSTTATSTFAAGVDITKGLQLNTGYFYGAGLASCTSTSALTWINGQFGCQNITNAISNPFNKSVSLNGGNYIIDTNNQYGNPGEVLMSRGTAAGDIWVATSTLTTISGILPVASGGTGNTTFTGANLLYGNDTGSVGSIATTSVTCGGSASCTAFTAIGAAPITLKNTFDFPSNATSTKLTFNSGIIASSGTSTGNWIAGAVGIGTSTPGTSLGVTGAGVFTDQVRAFNFFATSTTASSTLQGLTANLLNVTSTSASSTFANGINLTAGCFAINGACVSGAGGGGSGTVGSGTTGQLPYYAAAGTALTATSDIFRDGSSRIGIGTTTPALSQLVVASSTAPQLSLSAGAGLSQIVFANNGGRFFMASTTSVAGVTATTTNPALELRLDGSPLISVGTTSISKIINLGPDPSTTNSSSTIRTQRLQWEGLDAGGLMRCTFINAAGALTTIAGACN